MPDARTGERAVAVILPREGTMPDVAALAGFLAQSGVARFTVPETVAMWEALPRNDAGKVLKAAVHEWPVE